MNYLISLNLSDNDIHAEGAQKLAEALKGNTSLTDLNLHKNEIGSNGMRHLCSSLEYNTSLKSIILSQNEIHDVESLGRALALNQTLTNIDLSKNKFKTGGMKSVRNGLTDNYSLLSISLENESIARTDWEYVCYLIMRNSHYKQFCVDYFCWKARFHIERPEGHLALGHTMFLLKKSLQPKHGMAAENLADRALREELERSLSEIDAKVAQLREEGNNKLHDHQYPDAARCFTLAQFLEYKDIQARPGMDDASVGFATLQGKFLKKIELLESEKQQLQNKPDELKAAKAALSLSNQELESEKQERHNIGHMTTQLKERIDNLEEKLSLSNQELESKKQELHNMATQLKEITDELKEALSQLKAEKYAYSELGHSKHKLEDQNSELQDKLSQLSKEVNGAKDDIFGLEKEKRKLLEKVTNLESDLLSVSSGFKNAMPQKNILAPPKYRPVGIKGGNNNNNNAPDNNKNITTTPSTKEIVQVLMSKEERFNRAGEAYQTFLREAKHVFKKRNTPPPNVFISYCWEVNQKDRDIQQKWIQKLESDLQTCQLEVFFDLSKMHGHIKDRMVNSINDSSVFILIGTPRFKERVEDGLTNAGLRECIAKNDFSGLEERLRNLDPNTDISNVAFEYAHIWAKSKGNPNSVIPLLFSGNNEISFPPEIKQYLILDARDAILPEAIKAYYKLLTSSSGTLGIIPAIFEIGLSRWGKCRKKYHKAWEAFHNKLKLYELGQL